MNNLGSDFTVTYFLSSNIVVIGWTRLGRCHELCSGCSFFLFDSLIVFHLAWIVAVFTARVQAERYCTQVILAIVARLSRVLL